MNPRFYYALCQNGAEKAVKAEVAHALPDLRFAFSRPGFLTFKEESPSAEARSVPDSIYIRLWGISLAQVRNPEHPQKEYLDLLSKAGTGAIIDAFDRDTALPGDEKEGENGDTRIRALFDAADLPLPPASHSERNEGEKIFDLVWIDDNHVFLGFHLHDRRMLSCPGNRAPLSVPAHSPSRSWLKVEEAILRFRIPVSPGWQALEVGAAPGGATTALLDRGFTVYSIDPQYMDAAVSARKGAHHIRKPARFVTAEDLRGVNPDWIVMDMSISPKDAIAELLHVLKLLREAHGRDLNIRKGLFTLKLNDWKHADESREYIARLEKAGFGNIAAFQLASCRQEFFAYSSRLTIRA